MKRRRIPKWDEFFLGLAEYVSRASKDPSTKVGAVLVSPDRTDIVLGYNGFARKMRDDKKLYADRKTKYGRIVHAEMNAVMLARRPVEGYTLYTWPFISCDRCAVHMVQAGVTRAVAPAPTEEQEARWGESFSLTRSYFDESGVKLVEYALSSDNVVPKKGIARKARK